MKLTAFFLATAFAGPAFAGGMSAPIADPVVTPPTVECERYLTPGTNYYQWPRGCGPYSAPSNGPRPVREVEPPCEGKDCGGDDDGWENPKDECPVEDPKDDDPQDDPKDDPKDDDDEPKGNPGNDKPVGGAGEHPNGKDGWGDGDRGRSD